MFKKVFVLLVLSVLLTGLTACDRIEQSPSQIKPEPVVEAVVVEPIPESLVEPEPKPEPLLPGKIAIVTNARNQDEEAYRSAQYIQNKFGEEYVIHRIWPDAFAHEGEKMIQILSEIADDPDVRVLVINQAVMNTNAAVEAFRERRDDVFIICAHPHEQYNVITKNANLILGSDVVAGGERMALQAKAMGAETFVHYSYHFHYFGVVPFITMRRDAIREACERLGIKFIELYLPHNGPEIFLLHDVLTQTKEHGKNTAFFSTRHRYSLLKQVLTNGAIYVQPSDSSPFHTFPEALNLFADFPPRRERFNPFEMFSPAEIIEAIGKETIAAGMMGRLSTPSLYNGRLFTFAAVEYGIKWMHGEVPKEEIDMEILSQIMVDVLAEQTGVEGLGVDLTKHSFEGVIFSNFILVAQDYLIF